MLRFLVCTLCAVSCSALSLSAVAAPSPSARPALFSTAMILVRTTPYAEKWRAASSEDLGAAFGIAQKARQLQTLDRIRFVNRAVNAQISYQQDTGDVWTKTSRTFLLGKGDCEDLAIAKLQILQSAGLAASDLFLVIGRDLVSGQGHAVLVARYKNQNLVLDNFSDNLLTDTTYIDFQPIITMSGNQSWLHGKPAINPKSITSVIPGQRP